LQEKNHNLAGQNSQQKSQFLLGQFPPLTGPQTAVQVEFPLPDPFEAPNGHTAEGAHTADLAVLSFMDGD
jgi:hypothetical protein